MAQFLASSLTFQQIPMCPGRSSTPGKHQHHSHPSSDSMGPHPQATTEPAFQTHLFSSLFRCATLSLNYILFVLKLVLFLKSCCLFNQSLSAQPSLVLIVQFPASALQILELQVYATSLNRCNLLEDLYICIFKSTDFLQSYKILS